MRGYVDEVVISLIARHRRSYEHDDFVNPLHYLALLEQKTGALDQAAPLAGWDLPAAGCGVGVEDGQAGQAGVRAGAHCLRPSPLTRCMPPCKMP